MKVEAAIVIPRKNYGFVTFSSIAPVEQLLEMREPLEIAGSEVFLRQVDILIILIIAFGLFLLCDLRQDVNCGRLTTGAIWEESQGGLGTPGGENRDGG